MPPLEPLIVLSTSGLLGLSIVAAVAAWSWRGWLELQHHRFDRLPRHSSDLTLDLPAIGARIDLADLKERIRKLEAIAAGVEL